MRVPCLLSTFYFQKLPLMCLTRSLRIAIMDSTSEYLSGWVVRRSGLKREDGVKPSRTRRCNRWRKPHQCHWPYGLGRRGE